MAAISLGTALVASAAIGGGAAVAGAKSSGKAIKNSAQASVANNTANNALARENRDMLVGKIDPFYQTGVNATGQINALLSGNAGEAGAAFDRFKGSTGYQGRLDEGYNAINTGYAANGLLQSGAAQKSLLKFGQQQASGEFGNYMGYLGNQQQIGLGATNALAGVGTNFTNQVTANNNQNSTNQANAALAQANVKNQMYGGLAGAAGQIFGALGTSYGSPSGGTGTFGGFGTPGYGGPINNGRGFQWMGPFGS